jgi:6-phosphogluconolactonase
MIFNTINFKVVKISSALIIVITLIIGLSPDTKFNVIAENESKKLAVYVGTYSLKGGNGIYKYTFDTNTRQFKFIGIQKELNLPSYLAIDRERGYLYSVAETGTFQGKYGGGVGAYSIDKTSGNLRFVNAIGTKEKGPCHLSLDPQNKYLFTANYNDGSISAIKLGNKGDLTGVGKVLKHEGSLPHYVTISNSKTYLFAVEKGFERLAVYDYIPTKNIIKPAKVPFVNLEKGTGPRHMTISKDDKYMYVINEKTSDIQVLECSLNKLEFKKIQRINLLPSKFKRNNYSATVRISKDGRYLYAANRGLNTISVLKIDKETGKLKLIANTSARGKFTKDFNFDPSGKFLFAVNQDSDSVLAYSINTETGHLSPISAKISIPNPQNVETFELK